jgi:hypothetical protein
VAADRVVAVTAALQERHMRVNSHSSTVAGAIAGMHVYCVIGSTCCFALTIRIVVLLAGVPASDDEV